MKIKDLLGKKLQIIYRDIGSTYNSKVTLYVFAASESEAHTTTEVRILLSGNVGQKFPPCILLGMKNKRVVSSQVFLPWVRTDNPNDCFVTCEFELI